jgi:uncharacterized protein YpiB (UPF0302 family)
VTESVINTAGEFDLQVIQVKLLAKSDFCRWALHGTRPKRNIAANAFELESKASAQLDTIYATVHIEGCRKTLEEKAKETDPDHANF